MQTHWLLFIANLPGRNQTLRMRVWRSLKAAGAGALRDGAYLLPSSGGARDVFARQSREIQEGGGKAYTLELPVDSASAQGKAFRALFDRSKEYEALALAVNAFQRKLARLEQGDARRKLAALRRNAASISVTDYFPGESRAQVERALTDLESLVNARFSPEEPRSAKRKIKGLDRRAYQRRTWATRERLWIDRVCSAWLIRRFIDPAAKFIWLKRPKDCPRRAVGFDFDGAAFTHVESKVTFEVLLASFSLDENPALVRLGTLVHYLDVGGLSVPEAPGLAAIVSGARALQPDDDALLKSVSPALDSLYRAFSEPES